MIRRMMGLSWMCTGSVSQLAFGFAEPQRGLARSKALIVMGESPGEIESSAGQQQLLFRHRFELFWHGADRHWDLRVFKLTQRQRHRPSQIFMTISLWLARRRCSETSKAT